MLARVNKIIPMSVVDGPGNRTAVFFQGCNIDCFYCHNPETIEHCIHCGVCVSQCPSKALTFKDQKVVWLEEKCTHCDNCIKVCPHNSSPKIHFFTPKALTDQVKKSMPFIQGVTVSGGEATLQVPFLKEFFKNLKELGLTTFVDTNGTVDLEKEEEFLSLCDKFMVDVKAFDEEQHRDITGYGNKNVLKNLQLLARLGKIHEIRTVCVEGFKNEQTIRSVSEFLPNTDFAYRLIQYRPFGVREEYSHFRSPSKEEMRRLQEVAQSYGYSEVTVI